MNVPDEKNKINWDCNIIWTGYNSILSHSNVAPLHSCAHKMKKTHFCLKIKSWLLSIIGKGEKNEKFIKIDGMLSQTVKLLTFLSLLRLVCCDTHIFFRFDFMPHFYTAYNMRPLNRFRIIFAFNHIHTGICMHAHNSVENFYMAWFIARSQDTWHFFLWSTALTVRLLFVCYFSFCWLVISHVCHFKLIVLPIIIYFFHNQYRVYYTQCSFKHALRKLWFNSILFIIIVFGIWKKKHLFWAGFFVISFVCLTYAVYIHYTESKKKVQCLYWCAHCLWDTMSYLMKNG